MLSQSDKIDHKHLTINDLTKLTLNCVKLC
jgi:hypothetical protein